MLIDYAETERVGQWSLRSALVRYAQPEPVRAGHVLELVRRLDAALGPSRSMLEKSNNEERLVALAPAWSEHSDDADGTLIGLLAVALELDELADEFAGWANDISQTRPTDQVDQRCAYVLALLDELGVTREAIDPSEWRGRGPKRGV